MVYGLLLVWYSTSPSLFADWYCSHLACCIVLHCKLRILCMQMHCTSIALCTAWCHLRDKRLDCWTTGHWTSHWQIIWRRAALSSLVRISLRFRGRSWRTVHSAMPPEATCEVAHSESAIKRWQITHWTECAPRGLVVAWDGGRFATWICSLQILE